MENGRNHRFRKIGPFHQIEAQQLPTLPEEIIEEIMSRLPVKSLLKFRCVSKWYRSLISRKKFIKTHLENSSKNTNFTHQRIILDIGDRDGPKRFCSSQSLWDEPITYSFTVDNPMTSSWTSVVGCCNGLVCIMGDEGYFLLWNPSTRISKKLPAMHSKVESGGITKYGFGYDECNDDYKEYDVNESWDKVVTVPYPCGFSWRAPLLTPLCLGPNGEILFSHQGGTFMIYYPENGLFSERLLLTLDAFFVTDVYVESLVPLVSDGEQAENQEIMV